MSGWLLFWDTCKVNNRKRALTFERQAGGEGRRIWLERWRKLQCACRTGSSGRGCSAASYRPLELLCKIRSICTRPSVTKYGEQGQHSIVYQLMRIAVCLHQIRVQTFSWLTLMVDSSQLPFQKTTTTTNKNNDNNKQQHCKRTDDRLCKKWFHGSIQ